GTDQASPQATSRHQPHPTAITGPRSNGFSETMHYLAGIKTFIPIEALAPNALLDNDTGKATSTQNRSDCRRGGEGWVEYGALDTVYDNRATGVEACLDSNYLDTHEGSSTVKEIKPPAYQWARKYVMYLGGLAPSSAINACHLLGSDLSGSGTDLRNLATCSRQANTAVRGDGRIADHMFSYESQVKHAIDSGQVVYYSVRRHPLSERDRLVRAGCA
ncbi:DNA/RNA non-specific endonuclease, partial [Streptomyces sp. GXMU-J15]